MLDGASDDDDCKLRVPGSGEGGSSSRSGGEVSSPAWGARSTSIVGLDIYIVGDTFPIVRLSSLPTPWRLEFLGCLGLNKLLLL